MRYFSYLLLFVFFSSMSGFSQEKIIKHTVSKGETISEIADKYNIKTSAIYELNPKAKKGIKFKTVLLIPTKSKKHAVSTPEIATNHTDYTHEVLPKETLYGIAKQYNASVEDLYKMNPNLEKEGLRKGEKINVPQTESDNLASTSTPKIEFHKTTIPEITTSKKEIVVSSKPADKEEIKPEGIVREVLPKESLYSIAKQYGIKLSDLQNANSSLGTSGLKVGQKIIIPVKADANLNLATAVKPIKLEKEVVVLPKPIVEIKKGATTEITHEVLPKESLYSIAKQYKITIADLQKVNSALGNKALKVGQKIIVPVKNENNTDLVAKEEVSKTEKEILVSPQPTHENKTVELEATHKVLPKETKYGIAKEYGISVKQLEEQNPKIVKELLVGYELKIRSSKIIETSAPVQEIVTKDQVVKVDSDKIVNTVEHDSVFVDKLISTASENIGTRYRSGGMTKDGFDCSGLMCSTFGAYNIQLPRSSMEMSSYGVKINTEKAQKGDLIFFKTRGGRRINHVGMVVEVIDGDIKFIHSSTGGGVIISSIKEKYYDKNFVQINHVL